jgi:hypothetical protein
MSTAQVLSQSRPRPVLRSLSRSCVTAAASRPKWLVRLIVEEVRHSRRRYARRSKVVQLCRGFRKSVDKSARKGFGATWTALDGNPLLMLAVGYLPSMLFWEIACLFLPRFSSFMLVDWAKQASVNSEEEENSDSAAMVVQFL